MLDQFAAMFRRATFTTEPPIGDYIITPTGYTWNVRCSTGPGIVLAVSEGARTRADAFAMVVRLAEGTNTDAWETAGAGLFRRIHRSRPRA
jgi:hypothetical protein